MGDLLPERLPPASPLERDVFSVDLPVKLLPGFLAVPRRLPLLGDADDPFVVGDDGAWAVGHLRGFDERPQFHLVAGGAGLSACCRADDDACPAPCLSGAAAVGED